MRWGLKDLLALTVIVALVLVARSMVVDSAPSFFTLGLYMSQATVVYVLAWHHKGSKKAPLITYAVFAWIFGAYFLDPDYDVMFTERMAVVGVALSGPSSLTVWMISRPR